MRRRLHCTWPVALLGVCLSVGPAAANEASEAQRAAEAAAEVVDRHCADVVAGRATESAEAVAAVSLVLAQVSRAHDAGGVAYLLYWRGLLNACVGLEERGVEDLQAFLAGVRDDPAYAAQATEARARLRRLTRGVGGDDDALQVAPGIVLGGALLGAGGTLAGLSGWQGQVTAERQIACEAGTRTWTATDTIRQEGEAAAGASNALLAASIGSGVAGAVVIAVAAATGRRAGQAAVLVPLPEGGVALQVGGCW